MDVQDAKLYMAMRADARGAPGPRGDPEAWVELMVCRVVPEVVENIETTNHAAGRKPYGSVGTTQPVHQYEPAIGNNFRWILKKLPVRNG